MENSNAESTVIVIEIQANAPAQMTKSVDVTLVWDGGSETTPRLLVASAVAFQM